MYGFEKQYFKQMLNYVVPFKHPDSIYNII
jgi:hypothetical protein